MQSAHRRQPECDVVKLYVGPMDTVVVEVDSDGRGTLVDVLNAPKDPYLFEQLWWSLRNRTFQPATVSGHPVPTRIILLVEKVDVGG